MRRNFTKAFLDGLALPEKGRVFHYDEKIRHLAIMVTTKGAKSFYVNRKVNGKLVQVWLGTYPELSIERARKKAEEVNGQIAMGLDPTEKLKTNDPTFGELFDWYMEAHAKLKNKSWKAYQYHFDRYLSTLSKVKVSKISKADIRELHARLGEEHGPYSANRAIAILRAVFNRAIKQDKITVPNPALGIEMFKEQSRDRRLFSSEMDDFISAVMNEHNPTIRDFVLLSLFTGARKENVLSMRWDQIDFKGRIWRIPETKNGTPQTIPLLDIEIAILNERYSKTDSPWVFPGDGETGHLVEAKTGWKRILQKAKITDLRIHDLRRTLGSLMADSGASLQIIGKALNHKSPAATQIYSRIAIDPVRKAKETALEGMNNLFQKSIDTEAPNDLLES